MSSWVPVGHDWFLRLAARFRAGRRRAGAGLDPCDPTLLVVAHNGDDAESCSALLERCAGQEPAWTPSAPAVSRFHLRVPVQAVEEAAALAAQAGYRRIARAEVGTSGSCAYADADSTPDNGTHVAGAGTGREGTESAPPTGRNVSAGQGDPACESLVLARVEVLDALHLSQERSRMAGLAQRSGGTVRGWDALQPDPAGVGSARDGRSGTP